ncbi:MAG: hypothetical protein HYX32_14525 [Actinobacteria bacterium]|nr:hypothetical protein [Actinomycetota bacterium]
MNLYPPTNRLHALKLPAFVASLVVALVGLQVAAGALPPVPGGRDLWSFVQHTDPIVVTFSALRLLALVLCWYLLASSLLGVLARLTRITLLVRAVDVVTLPSVRRLLRGVAGMSLATSLAAGGVGTGAVIVAARPTPAIAAPALVFQAAAGSPNMRVIDEPPATPPVTMRVIDEPPATPPVTMRVIEEPGAPPGDAGSMPPTDRPTMRVLDEPVAAPTIDAPSPTTTTTTPATTGLVPPTTAMPPSTSVPSLPSPTVTAAEPAPLPAPATDAPTTSPAPPPTPTPPPATWTITPGDHLWHVAETALHRAWGRTPSDAETASYLQRLVAENRSVFAVPGNADLVFAGQVFTLPAP